MISHTEGDGKRVSSHRADVTGVIATLLGAGTRCISILMHLSLSLSLSWRGWLSARSESRRSSATSPGNGRREGHPRALSASASRRLALAGGVSLSVLVGGLAFASVGALAAMQYPLVRQLSSGLQEPNGPVAVDGKTGDVFVPDTEGNQSVLRVLNASGEFVGTWAGANTPGASFGEHEIHSVAADDASGDVYVADRSNSVVDVFEASGAYVCQITGAGSATTSASECDGSAPGTPHDAFGEPNGVAVDQATGDVYVSDSTNEVVDVFNSAGRYLSQITGASTPAGSFSEVRSMAVDDVSGDLLVADSGGVVYVFDAATGAYLETWSGSAVSNPPGAPSGSFGGSVSVAVNDASGDVYVSDSGDGVVDELESTGAYVGQITGVPGALSSFLPQGVAVGQSTGEVYVYDAVGNAVDVFEGQQVVVPDVTTGAASEASAVGATLTGAVNPDGVLVSGCRFEYGPTTSYGQSAACMEVVGSGSGEVQVHAVVAGLTPATTYHFRLVASNANGTSYGSDETVPTLPVPVIESAATKNVAAASADLTARINPEGYKTTYRFEWGTSTAYGTNVPAGEIAAGAAGVSVTAHLVGLSTDTTYHWRVLATSQTGTSVSSDHTFVYETTGAGLPDGRAYEMVTPSVKNGALINTATLPSISEDGSRVILTSLQCLAGAESCTAVLGREGQPYLFSRTSSGWMMAALAPAATRYAPSTAWLANADTGDALFSMATAPAFEDDWYTHEPGGSFEDVGPGNPPSAGRLGPRFIDSLVHPVATADLSHLVWMATAEPVYLWPFDGTISDGGNSVYEYAGAGNSQPVMVGVTGPAGSHDLVDACGTEISGSDEKPGALSADGRTVFFTALSGGPGWGGGCFGTGANAGTFVPVNELFARIEGSRTASISERSPLECTAATGCAGSPASKANFEGASEDGSKVFFTSTQRLTDSASEDNNPRDTGLGTGCDGTTAVNGCNLYEYDFANPVGRNLLSASAGDSSGGGPRVQGVMALSADGSHVYFVARGVLTGVANDQGQIAQDGSENLYVFERDAAFPAGHVAFVASLPESDSGEWGSGPLHADVSPDGRFLVFTSHGRLTADDRSTSGGAQVFMYDAQTGALTRVSVGNDGFNDNGNAGVGNAYVVPPVNFANQAGPERRDPTMSNDGSFVFFMSPIALTPGAIDDVRTDTTEQGEALYAQNVYEYHQGHVYLISDGRDVSSDSLFACANDQGDLSSVCLIGTDATGANVFFTTADPLVAADTDTQLDFYDARICTAAEPCVASSAPSVASCQGEACHAAAGAEPVAPGAATVTFAGSGNLAPPAPAVKAKPKAKPKAKARHKPRAKRKAKGSARRRARQTRNSHNRARG